MGVWTEAVITCELKNDVPQQVINVLNYLINPVEDLATREIPSHPFFQRPDWHMTLAMDCAYFPGDTIGVLKRDEYSSAYHLTIRCKVKYGGLVTGLLHWLAPYMATQGFLGYRREDENDEITLLYRINDKAFFAKVPSLQRTEITEDMF